MTIPLSTDSFKSKEQLNSNGRLAKHVLKEVISTGVTEFCLCPGARNAPLVYPLVNSTQTQIYHWAEERSAAFFALGRIKSTGKPTAVVTTSGTAAAELLPAVMEAFYTGLPLILITADRPKRFRGTGAPQSAEQVGIYSHYTHTSYDLAYEEECSLGEWKKLGPLHINICFEEPEDLNCQSIFLDQYEIRTSPDNLPCFDFSPSYSAFLEKCTYPFVVVGALPFSQREAAVRFLFNLNIAFYAEGVSGIREDPRLEHLRIQFIDQIWQVAESEDYPIDGILRLGGIPTARLWRDLENQSDRIQVYSISEHPFSGLSWSNVIQVSFSSFFDRASAIKPPSFYPHTKWKIKDRYIYQHLLTLFKDEPLAEESLIHALSKIIPKNSKIYLGNSLPIRGWDIAATYEARNFHMNCNRGVNGIDGQASTFLGFCSENQDNWALLGDLTLLYDLVAPWITAQLPNISANIIVINNGGAAIFERMFTHPAFRNRHQLSFKPLADLWGWQYEKWECIPKTINPSQKGKGRLIELIPNANATARFLEMKAKL